MSLDAPRAPASAFEFKEFRSSTPLSKTTIGVYSLIGICTVLQKIQLAYCPLLQ